MVVSSSLSSHRLFKGVAAAIAAGEISLEVGAVGKGFGSDMMPVNQKRFAKVAFHFEYVHGQPPSYHINRSRYLNGTWDISFRRLKQGSSQDESSSQNVLLMPTLPFSSTWAMHYHSFPLISLIEAKASAFRFGEITRISPPLKWNSTALANLKFAQHWT